MSGIPVNEPCCLPQADGLTYLKIGPRQIVVGMMGLETIFKQLLSLGRSPEEISDAEIIGMARKSNYIRSDPEAEANYAAALRKAYAGYYERVSRRP
jgi:hypothetical protein